MKINRSYDYPKYYPTTSMYFAMTKGYNSSGHEFSDEYAEESRKHKGFYCVRNHPDILFDFPYKSTSPFSYGMEYKIRQSFLGQPPKDSNRKSSLFFRVQFSDNLVISRVPYSLVVSHDIFNPYFRYYWDVCGIGNIKVDRENRHTFVDEVTESINFAFDVWYTIMSRCFNPQDPNYAQFGGIGVMPLYYRWVMFEEFYKYFMYYESLPGILGIRDPNDPYLYNQSSFLFTGPEKNMILRASRTPGFRFDKLPARIVCKYPPQDRTIAMLNPDYFKPDDADVPGRSMCTVVRK